MISLVVSKVVRQPRSPFVVVYGESDLSVSAIFFNGSSIGTAFPNPGRWERAFRVVDEISIIEIYGEDILGNLSAPLYLTFTTDHSESFVSSVFGSLDEYGLLVNTPRLIGEKNSYYRQRLLHAETHLGGAHYPRLIQAVRRELSFEQQDEVLTIDVKLDADSTRPNATAAFVYTQPTRLCLEADQIRKDNEAVILDPGSREFLLSQEPVHKSELRITTRSGEIIPAKQVEILKDRRTIRVHGSPLELSASYRYIAGLPFSTYPTITTLATAIDAVIGVDSIQLFSSTITSGHGPRASKNLVLLQRTLLLADTSVTLDWVPLRLIEMEDWDYQQSLLDVEGEYFDTKLERLARAVSERSRIFFQNTVLDQDRVVADEVSRGLSALPHLWDPRLAYYVSSDQTDQTRYNYDQFLGWSGASPVSASHVLYPVGLIPNQLRTGMGDELVALDVVEE